MDRPIRLITGTVPEERDHLSISNLDKYDFLSSVTKKQHHFLTNHRCRTIAFYKTIAYSFYLSSGLA